ncbi:hypothetical protein [Chryseobacterium sp.]|uniref:hypothetical protein n=1 Tax=Chryseobacterium sp. TaxID=1871047 RepID=UPI0011C8AB3E|nr:hypothetical protein [Chryseobacterium sp.]TXF76245.1 hypothetical protein FUA25_10195 [Chryseobacterium sp.]
MTDLELLHFDQLKNEVQAQYLENHTPSFDEISKWKGIDIIYFQEDLRKKAKGNISEKSFYTYFKSPVTRLPRIDMLNLLAVYAGYVSWYDFKKNHLFADEVLLDQETEKITEELSAIEIIESETAITEQKITGDLQGSTSSVPPSNTGNADLQKTDTENQHTKPKPVLLETYDTSDQRSTFTLIKKYIWLGISLVLAVLVALLIFKEEIFSKEFTYTFIDADRNSKINDELDVKILKENESPIFTRVLPNQPFVYTTRSKTLKMVVSSPYYKTDTINRNLETAPSVENIELRPNDYAIMLFFYSKSITDLKKKRLSLNYLISDNALIYQVYDNETYGVETLDKQRYINLVTLPSTSLENLEVIDTQTNDNGKIVMIKFKIGNNEEKK